MNFGGITKRAVRLAKDNAPAALTALGVTGALTTAYLAAKGAFKASEIIRNEQEERIREHEKNKRTEEEMDVSLHEKIDLTWKCFVPAAGMAAVTVTCIVAANHIGTRRAAALASAYSLSEKAMSEYKNKVVEKMGAEKEKEVRDDIAQDKVNDFKPSKQEVVIMSSGDLCFDTRSGRPFTSDMESLRAAVNETNEQIINESYASLTDFYDRIGLEKTDESDDVGWASNELLKVDYHPLMHKGRPCLAITFETRPKIDFYITRSY